MNFILLSNSSLQLMLDTLIIALKHAFNVLQGGNISTVYSGF